MNMFDIEFWAQLNKEVQPEDSSCSESVYLYEYDLTEIKSKCSSSSTRNLSDFYLGETPHLSIVVYEREFEVESDGPRWIHLRSVCILRKIIFCETN